MLRILYLTATFINFASISSATLTIPQLIEKDGFPCEVHHVVTPDRYILTLHRIPHGRTIKSPSKGVVHLQHGLLSSSADWVITGPSNALAYILADEGYDVWLGNARGNSQSRNHTQLNPSQPKFWDFSWHEIGLYDEPTMIDYILAQTKKDKLFSIGHSQGTTGFYVMTSLKPEYNDKIIAHISLAPVAYMSHLMSPLMHYIAFFDGPIEVLMKMVGNFEFLPNTELVKIGSSLLCADGDVTQILCTNLLFTMSGFDAKDLNTTMLPVLMEYTPAGSSTKQVLHYSQEIKSGHFRQYNYGMVGNFQKYGSPLPPDYKLGAVTAPVYLFYSHNDWMSSAVDVDRLFGELGNAKGKFLVGSANFNHVDYLYGMDAPALVYNKIISILATYHK